MNFPRWMLLVPLEVWVAFWLGVIAGSVLALLGILGIAAVLM